MTTLNQILKNNSTKMFTIEKYNNKFIFSCDNKKFTVGKEDKIYTIIKCNDKCKYQYDKDCDLFEEDLQREIKNVLVKNVEEKNSKYIDCSCIWVLGGQKKCHKNYTGIQVGRSESLKLMFENDIIPDAEAIIGIKTNKNKDRYDKYNKLFDKYDSLSFYLVDIDKYLENDDEIIKILQDKVPEKKNLKQFYYYCKASYAEGKIGKILHTLYPNDCIYNQSSPDKFIAQIKNKKE